LEAQTAQVEAVGVDNSVRAEDPGPFSATETRYGTDNVRK